MTKSQSAILFAAGLGLQLLWAAPASADSKGKEVAKRVDKTWSHFKGEAAKVEMQLITADGQKATRKLTSNIRENSEVEKLMITLVWPPDQKGVRLLTWEHRGKDDDQWIYLPSLKRTKRISARGKTGSFLGSEFTYEDLKRPLQIDKYKFKFVRNQTVGKRKTWVIEAYPKDKYSGYSKQVAWVDATYQSPLRIDYYDRKGKLLKSQNFKNYKKYNGKWWRADRLEMVNRQNGKKSIFIWNKRTLGSAIADEKFSPGAIEN